MKKKRIITTLIAGVLLISVTACTAPGEQISEPQYSSEIAEEILDEEEDSETPLNEETRGASGRLVIATALETTSVAPARHNTFIGTLKNLMTHNSPFRSQFNTLEPVPDIVDEWRAISDTLFEFRLHEGILFHNGEEMTAYDVEASFHYLRQYPYARNSHASAEAIEVIDRYTFTLYTGTPNAVLFFDLIAHGNAVLPKSLIESGHDFTTQPVGAGPFVFEEWRFGDSLHFRAFEDYWNPERAPQIEEVVWRIIPEPAQRTIALEMGEVDYVMEVAFGDVPRLEENPDVAVFMRPGTTFNMLLLNHNRPQFENVYARKAINMAIDQEALTQAAFNGLAVPTRAQLPTVFAGTSYEGTVAFDPEGARALLAEHNIDPQSLGFEMIASTEERRRMGEVVQSQLADIGIPTTVIMMDHATSLARFSGNDYEAGFGQWGASFLISTLRGVVYGGPEGTSNRSNVNHQQINELIREGIATIDTDARNAIFEQVSVLANEYFVNVPTHQTMVVNAFNSRLRVPEINAMGIFYVNMIYWTE